MRVSGDPGSVHEGQWGPGLCPQGQWGTRPVGLGGPGCCSRTSECSDESSCETLVHEEVLTRGQLRKHEAGSRKQEAGSRKQEAGCSWGLEKKKKKPGNAQCSPSRS
ncbi:hypothetical protein EYF80_041131 [Liparis tanakae]|uniref:Uncharacterized protein n=1 Tax=Liparis tanakae TaxID=230148 RepID=A0A4Z2G793_9TELE|nr:hypothetical protein EYF80_041131 [Liparis tanakae]